MSDQANETHNEASKALDLSSLDSLSLGPNWSSSDGRRKETRAFRDYDSGKQEYNRKGGARRDRRGPRRPREGQRSDSMRREKREPFKPCVEVSFYPEDAPFKVLTHAVRTSYRTYELFEIARLILEKADRFVVVVRPLASKEEPFFVSVRDGLPFMSEEEAINHALTQHTDHFFDREIVDVEPPKGNFTQVNRCSISGVLLGPPNYHRYQDLLKAHYEERFSHMAFDRYQSKIEAVKDEAVIQEWIESMKTETHYVLKPKQGEEIQTFDSFERARFYMVTHRKDELVRSTLSARFSGKALDLYPGRNEIKHSVEFALEHQRRFPLDTANHLRGRLRRMNFSVYKKGSKGISYICGVKRRFRSPGQSFSESVQMLIDFIDAHPKVMASTLPEVYLGLNTKEPAPAESTEDDADSAPVAEVVMAPEDEKALKQLSIDLRWLVSEGYVIEYSDGRLLAMAVKEEPKPKAELKTELKAVEDKATQVVETEKVMTPETEEPKTEKVPAVSEEPTEEIAPAADESKEEVVENTPEVDPVAVTPEVRVAEEGDTVISEPVENEVEPQAEESTEKAVEKEQES